ncbi:hypothetical protein KEJ50_04845 [Candidatus Bathyarchaeota archaeon]|nr:hypothetical protein [Candidatus Bathyarchaeota archaeon]
MVEAIENIREANIKGYVFEEVVGGAFRWSFDSALLLAPLLDFMAKMLNLSFFNLTHVYVTSEMS